jgi:ABC-type protease/lipase transport system fused ATPase/permease subunit
MHHDVDRSFRRMTVRDAPSGAVDTLALWRSMARRTLAAAAAFSIFANVLMLAMPVYVLRMADRVLSGGIDPLLILPGLTLGLLATMSMLDILRRRPLSRLGATMETVLGSAVLSAMLMSTLPRDGGQMRALRALHKVRGFLSSPAMLVLLDVPLTPVFFAVIFLINFGLGAIVVIAALVVSNVAYLKRTDVSRIVRVAAPVAIVGWGVHLMLAGILTAGMTIAASIIARRALQTLEDAIAGREDLIQARAEYLRVRAHLEGGELWNTDAALHPAPVSVPLASNVLLLQNSAAKRRHIAMSC